jgi:tight adherence protein B
MSGYAVIWIGLGSVAVFAFVALLLAVLPGAKAQPSRSLAAVLAADQSTPVVFDSRPDAVPMLSSLLSRTTWQRSMQIKIVRAGLLLRPSELIAISVTAALLGLVGGFVVGRVMGALLGAILLGLAPLLYIAVREEQRRRALMHQLPDVVDLMAASLRAGHGFSQALKTVSEQGAPPFADEARRSVDELGLGLSLEQALDRMVVRTNQGDIELMCTAVQIQSRTGGNLAEILRTLGEVIRERIRLHGEIAALTAEGRLSGVILVVLPIALGLLLEFVISPGWLQPLFSDPIGHIIFGGGVVAMLVGIVVIRQMLQMDV